MDAVFQFVNGPNAQVVIDADKMGNVTVRVKPRFRSPEARPDVAYLHSEDTDGEVISQQVLQISGATGDIVRRVLSQESVLSAYEQRKAAAKPGGVHA